MLVLIVERRVDNPNPIAGNSRCIFDAKKILLAMPAYLYRYINSSKMNLLQICQWLAQPCPALIGMGASRETPAAVNFDS